MIISKKNISILILCGGKGERLRPLTSSTPKPLIPINNKPILSYIIDHLKAFDFKEYIIAAGYKAEKISTYFSNNNDNHVRLLNAGDVDIIERIRDARKHILNDVIICYGDTVSDVDLDNLINFHEAHSEKATVTVWPLKSQFGLFTVDDNGSITTFEEKPTLDKWINIGYFFLENEVLSWLDGFEKFEDFLEYLVEKKELNGFKHKGIHITINTLRELEDAEENINNLKILK